MTSLPWDQLGVAICMLIVLVGFHWRSIKGGEKRENQFRLDAAAHREQCQDDAKILRAECRKDTDKLVDRIQDLEDRQYKDAIGMAKMCGDALKMHAETQRRWIEIGVETARHTALDPKGKP